MGLPAPPAIVDGDVRLTADEVEEAAGRLAGALTSRGAGTGDVVAFQLANWWESIVAFHACWRLGAVALPLHPRSGERHRVQVLGQVEPAVLLDGAREEVDSLLAEATAASGTPEVSGGDLAVLLATSGSTGRPKLVRHTRGALGYKARTMVEAHRLTSEDVVLMPAPLAHVSGLLNGILLPGQAGMTTVLMDRWDPATALDLIAREQVSFMIGPPTFFVDLLSVPTFSAGAVESLRLVSCGGATVTPTFVEEAAERLGATVKRTYGSTEAPTITTWHAGDPPDKARTTDGRPVGSVELAVVDPTSGDRRGAGEVGELLVRGPEICAGYVDPADTAAAFDDEGWFHTGDLARIDDEGWLTVVGRVGSTIIRGGENVSPAAVEAVCDGVPGVRQSVVVGYPDDRLGERVGVVVEADRSVALDEVRAACEAAGLIRFSWPERLLVVEALPRLDAGKPDRATLTRLLTQSM